MPSSKHPFRLWLPDCIPHRPSGRQHATLLLKHKREILYGGAVGGGKSDWLLMEALRYVDVPGYAALLLRRTRPRLDGAEGLIERSKEWLSGSEAQWLEGKLLWTFPSGATVRFGHMEMERQKRKFNSQAYDMIGFDELVEFEESQYTYMFSRLRRLKGSWIPPRVRAASNPGDIGHDWVRRRFMVEAHPDRVFVPAKLHDNPHLDHDEYMLSLAHLHPFEQQQLVNGDWDVRPPGSRFKREWFRMRDTSGHGGKLVRFWDIAATEPKKGRDPDYTVGALLRHVDGKIVIEDIQRFRGTPGTVDARLVQTAQLDGREVAIWIEEEPGSSGKIASEHFRKLLAGYTARMKPSTGPKEVRANALAAYAEGGLVEVLVRDWTEELLRELERFPSDGAHDDQVDACAGAFNQLVQPGGATPSGMYGDHLYPTNGEAHESA